MDVAKFLERYAKKWPGIVQVVSALTVIVALVWNEPEKDLALWQIALIMALAFLFHWLGSRLDDLVFDPLYGLRPSSPLKRGWRIVARILFAPIKFFAGFLARTKVMATERKAAAEKLRGTVSGSPFTCRRDEDYSGVYACSNTLFDGSDEWNDHVKPWLELSKTIRSFVWPLTALLVYDLERDRWHMALLDRVLSAPYLKWLALWPMALVALFLALLLYVWLGVFHMHALYRLVNNSEFILFSIGHDNRGEYRTVVPARYLAIGETTGRAKRDPRPVFLLAGT